MPGKNSFGKKQQVKFTENVQKEKKAEEYPSFSLRWMTNDKNYRPERYENDKKDLENLMNGFYDLMKKTANRSWKEWFVLSKKQGGIETLEAKELNHCKAKDDLEILKYISVRFGPSDRYRLIGFKEEAVFYVTGFDLDFSVYDHGS